MKKQVVSYVFGCDICGNQLENEDQLEKILIPGIDNKAGCTGFVYADICPDCKKRYMEHIYKTFGYVDCSGDQPVFMKADSRAKVRKPEVTQEPVVITVTDNKRSDIYKKQKAQKLIKERVKDPIADAWLLKMNSKLRSLSIISGISVTHLLRHHIYPKMNVEYGFVTDQVRKEYMDRYQLDEIPSVLRAITIDGIWMEIFESILNDIEHEYSINTEVVSQ